MKRKSYVILSMLVSLLIVFLNCPVMAAQTQELKIGFTAPLSGGGMSWGYGVLAGLELAMEDYNKAGGLKVAGKTYILKAIPYDSKYLADPAITAAKRLIYEDKVKIIFGEVGSAAALAIQTITEPLKIILFPNTYTAALLGPNKPYTFRWFVTNVEYVGPMMAFYKKKWPQSKRLAYFFPDDETGRDMLKWEIKAGAANGIEVVGFPWERGTIDLTPIVTKALGANIDIMDVNGSPPGEAGQMINMLRQMGWDKPIVRTGGSVMYDLLRLCGKNANGVIYHEDGDYDLPQSAALVKRFMDKKYPSQAPNAMMFPSYDGSHILFKAMQMAGTVDDTTKIRDAMLKIKTYDGVSGKVRWGGKELYGVDQQLMHPVFIGEIQDGKPKVIFKVEF
jgi:branched-chain amino acid transport system substrate-binding protein